MELSTSAHDDFCLVPIFSSSTEKHCIARVILVSIQYPTLDGVDPVYAIYRVFRY
jgi:hypothetical protein